MKKTALTLLMLVFATAVAMAQSVEDGIKFLYYQKNKSARETLKKVVDSKPKDAYAIYWLGVAYMAPPEKDAAKARAVYQKALNEGVNDPWIWVGMAHADILENGDINAAKQKFEQAITASTATKGKNKGNPDPEILNAIGRANAAGSAKQGDPQYGIEKLKKAIELDKTKPDYYINLGMCYLKLGGDRGGEAVEAFREATVIDPKYARAYERIGMIYRSQNNTESMNKWFGDAIAADPNYGPVFADYFEYYKDLDVNVAKEYLDKWVANADKDCVMDFYVADYLFRARKYQESLAKAKEMEAGSECKDDPRIKMLYAFNYAKLNDEAQTKANLDAFFAKAQPSIITPDFYSFAGYYLKNVKGSEAQAVDYLKKAVDLDTVKANQLSYLDTIAATYKATGDKAGRLATLQARYKLIDKPTNTDIFNLGAAALENQQYPLADSMFTIYKNKYPDQAYGYFNLVKSAQLQDSTGAKAVGPINDYMGFLMKDSVTNAKTIAYYHAIQGGYYANVTKDLDAAIAEFEKAVALDPANTQYAAILNQLNGVKNKKNAPPKAPAKPAGKSTK